MRGRRSVGLASSQGVENHLQFIASRNDDADRNCPQVKQQAKVVQVTVVEWILIVPLDLNGDTVLETVHSVRGRVHFVVVNRNLRIEALLDPTFGGQFRVDPARYLRLPAPADSYVALEQPEPR